MSERLRKGICNKHKSKSKSRLSNPQSQLKTQDANLWFVDVCIANAIDVLKKCNVTNEHC